MTELLKPGRDPRDELPAPVLRTDVLDIKDLKPGMELKGTVRNVIDFGAFVDIGVHQDGLVHISQICDRYLKHPPSYPDHRHSLRTHRKHKRIHGDHTYPCLLYTSRCV